MGEKIGCMCGNKAAWEFSVLTRHWECRECGERWAVKVVDAEAVPDVIPVANCPICGDEYEVFKKTAGGKLYERKTCGKRPCFTEFIARANRARAYAALSAAQRRILAGAEAEMRWMADARMCPVV